jgi:hypothetical protein
MPNRERFDSAMRAPFFAVGYRGWKTVETVKERLKDGPIDGILIIDSPSIFVSTTETW